ncbi:MAG: tripartite tricarboxylate transporter permease [Chloroflexota bacterium]
MQLDGLAEAFTISNILYITFGIILGYIVGAIPGLGKVTAAAIAIPLTFYMNPVSAIAFLVGISKGSTSGNAVSAILINTPGEPSSVPTALDGYPLAKQGKGKKALKVGLYASTIGDFVATVALILLTPPLAALALQIGRVELAAILLFALTFIAALSGKSMAKGLISGLIGLLLATIGIELETGLPRMTFGYLKLYDGLNLVPMAIGMVAIAEMLVQLEEFQKSKGQEAIIESDIDPDASRVTGEDWRIMTPSIIRGTLIGTFIGILPGLGASIASFGSYGLAQRFSKTPELFGKGNIEGVAAAESADNAVIPSSLIPLFSLGIPGSAIAAVLAAGFAIHGIIPGPLMLRDNPEFMVGVYGSMLIASVVMLIVGYVGLNYFIKVVNIHIRFLLPAVFFFSIMGSFLEGGGRFGVYIMIIFGLFGYFVKKLDYSFVTFLIGFIIGPEFELALRQAIIITRGENLLQFPIAIGFVALTIIVIIWMAIGNQVRSLFKGNSQATG